MINLFSNIRAARRSYYQNIKLPTTVSVWYQYHGSLSSDDHPNIVKLMFRGG